MKKLWATVERESNKTLDDVVEQLRDKVEDLIIQFHFLHDDDITSVDYDDSYDS